jgi:hypothetical protein
MKNIRHEIALWVQAVIFIGLWLLLVYVSNARPAVTLDALAKIPDVVFIYGIMYLIFTRWLWRLRMFRGWLIPFPDLQGTWKGTITSTWVDPTTNRSPDPIPVVLVIKQTFSTLTCAMHTRESSSFSTAASFHVDEDSESKSISYVYTNTPRVSVRDRSVVHDGATTLRVITAPEVRLEGEYWTNRKSTGEMSLTRTSIRLADGFEE